MSVLFRARPWYEENLRIWDSLNAKTRVLNLNMILLQQESRNCGVPQWLIMEVSWENFWRSAASWMHWRGDEAMVNSRNNSALYMDLSRFWSTGWCDLDLTEEVNLIPPKFLTLCARVQQGELFNSRSITSDLSRLSFKWWVRKVGWYLQSNLGGKVVCHWHSSDQRSHENQ